MNDPGTAEPVKEAAKELEHLKDNEPSGDEEEEVLDFLDPRSGGFPII
jgi:hypothetical protein